MIRCLGRTTRYRRRDVAGREDGIGMSCHGVFGGQDTDGRLWTCRLHSGMVSNTSFPGLYKRSQGSPSICLPESHSGGAHAEMWSEGSTWSLFARRLYYNTYIYEDILPAASSNSNHDGMSQTPLTPAQVRPPFPIPHPPILFRANAYSTATSEQYDGYVCRYPRLR